MWSHGPRTGANGDWEIIREGPLNHNNQRHGRWTVRIVAERGEIASETVWYLNGQVVTETEFERK
jgi:hypothetical protein